MNYKPKEARCPDCNCTLTEDESFDINVEVSEVIEYIVGHCDNCGKEFQWKNVFTFSHIEDIKES